MIPLATLIQTRTRKVLIGSTLRQVVIMMMIWVMKMMKILVRIRTN